MIVVHSFGMRIVRIRCILLSYACVVTRLMSYYDQRADYPLKCMVVDSLNKPSYDMFGGSGGIPRNSCTEVLRTVASTTGIRSL